MCTNLLVHNYFNLSHFFKKLFFLSEDYTNTLVFCFNSFLHRSWITTKPETQVNEQLRRNEDQVYR